MTHPEGDCYTNTMGEERRSHPRVRAYRPVRLQQSGMPKVFETLTKDVGVGGLRCVTTTVFPVATELQVELALATGELPLSVRARAMWFRDIPHSEQYELGVAFVDLHERDKRRLSAYFDRLTSHSVSHAK